jgi:hypothetical protein
MVDTPGSVTRVNEATFTAKYAIRSAYFPWGIKNPALAYYRLAKVIGGLVVTKPWSITKGFILRKLGKEFSSCLAQKVD